MDVVNCPRCGKIFTRINSSICPECEREEEFTFQNLKDFIRDHSECTLSELSEATNVSTRKILRYIRDGRLEISKGMQGEVRCEICNCPITAGHYCDSCRIKVSQNIVDMFSEDRRRKNGSKMHISH
jgi:uncharacterized C2H2 Zn-finger protein